MVAQSIGNAFVPPPTRAAAVASRLREEILHGKLVPGAPIRDTELAARLGVSITPIREAVAVLIAEGLVEVLPNKRRCVAVLTQKRAQDLMDVLGVVISAALERVAGTPAKRQDLARACDDFATAARAGDSQESEQPFRRFLEQLYALVDNEELGRTSEAVIARAVGMIRLYPSEHLLPLWAEAFDDIADLITSDSATAAVRARAFFARLVDAMAADRPHAAVVAPEL